MVLFEVAVGAEGVAVVVVGVVVKAKAKDEVGACG